LKQDSFWGLVREPD